MSTSKYIDLGMLVSQVSKDSLVCTVRACETDRTTRFDVCYLKSVVHEVQNRESTMRFRHLSGASYHYQDGGDRVLISGYIPY